MIIMAAYYNDDTFCLYLMLLAGLLLSPLLLLDKKTAKVGWTLTKLADGGSGQRLRNHHSPTAR